MKRAIVGAIFLLVGLCSAPATVGLLSLGYSAVFTPQWQTLRMGAGGQITSISIASDGTKLARNDTYGDYLYKPTGTCSGWGSTFPAPCWQQLATSNSISGIGVNPFLGGSVEIVHCDSNTNVAYKLWNGLLWVTTNLQSAPAETWVSTGQTTTQNANSNTTKGAGPFIYCDPANPDIVYYSSPSGVKYSTNGRSGASATFAAVTGIGSVGSVPAIFAVDPSSSVVGNVTQTLFIAQTGAGVYRTTNGGTAGGGSFSITTSSPTAYQRMCVDKFSQLWLVDATSTLRKFVSGSWSSSTPGGSPASVACDLTSASLGANHIVLGTYAGDLVITSNNGSTWSGPNFANTVSVSGAQPGWLGAANLQGGGALSMNALDVKLDSSGVVWMSSGVGVFTMASAAATGVWVANTVGVEQLVTTRIIVPPGTWPVASVWDRGVIPIVNPDVYSTSQYPHGTSNIFGSLGQILGGWDIDYAPTGSFMSVWIISNVGQGTAPSTSTDGGKTWTTWPTTPAVINQGGNIAVSTPTNWILVAGCPSANCGGISGTPVMSFTTNAAAGWTASNFTGGTPGVFVGQVGVGTALAADRVTAGSFCAFDGSQQFWFSSNNGATFAKTAATVDGFVNLSFLKSVPGNAGHYFYTSGDQGGRPGTNKFWKSTNSCTSFASLNNNLVSVFVFGFGAVQPGGATYPTIYAIGYLSGVYGLYQSVDGGTTYTLVNIPSNQQSYPENTFDGIVDLAGDPDVYGRINVGMRGSGGGYIDTQDACPSVNYSNVAPGAALSGPVTLTAQHSGQVPVSTVTMKVDGATIASFGAGPGPYSTSWNASGISVGSHTLSVATTGNCNGTATKSFTITTGANNLLLANGADRLLLTDGASKLCLSSGC